ncbi:hypothetical protein ACIQNG_18715 [Streptomyces sp. NPDC091377]|uniref:hypothetical protein n=1 Tax=Streptomyces sp. NPDC091377 TaxID=3365995 RepID=UPI0037F54AE0
MSGHDDRPADSPVVLYTSGASARRAVRTLTDLRDFATRQGWHPVHEVYDIGSAHRPPPQRVGWRAVERLLIERRAAGLVMATEREVAVTPPEQEALRTWLGSLPAFAAYPGAEHPDILSTGATDPGADLPAVPVPAAPDVPDVPEPVVTHRWSRSYAMIPASLCRVRGDVRAQLTLMGQVGEVVTAIQVVSRLAHNAVTHAQPADGTPARMTVRLSAPIGGGLAIDVQDPRPDLPLGRAALAGAGSGGLRQVRLLGVVLSCPACEGAPFKTVRARIRPV